MTFNNWIDTFTTEKGITGAEMLEAEGASGVNMIPAEILIDAIKAAPASEQRGIKAMLVKIDFVAPGRKPVLDYFTHLAHAIAI